MQSEIPHCGLIDFLLLLTSRRRRFQISGLSMSPLLQDGEDIIVTVFVYLKNPLQVNDIVVVRHPFQENIIMVKRIKAIEMKEKGEKKYFVQGDNLDASTDSRHFGLIDENLIIGKVICRFP